MAGWLPLFSAADPLSKRSILNLGFVSPTTDYKFINHITAMEQWGPSGGGWYGTSVWTQSIGTNGYPNVSIANTDNKGFGGGIRIPSSRQYGDGINEYYVMRWTGTGEVFFNLSAGSFTIQTGLSSGYGIVNSSRWTGTNPYIVLAYSGPANLFAALCIATDGTFANWEFYRLSDETDRNNGLIYRMPYKIMLKNHDPSALRFMDWHGGNISWGTRWEYRTPPSNPAFGGGGGGFDWNSSPKYGRTSGTNQYTLSSVTGTPVSMTHGEIVTCQFSNTMVRCFDRNSNGSLGTITNITVGSNGRVTTSLAHGFNTGDIVVHVLNFREVGGTMTSGSNVITSTDNTNIFNGMEVYHEYFPPGTVVTSSTSTAITVNNNATASGNNGVNIQFQPMPKLHYQPCTITVIDSTNYDTNVDTSTYGSFTGSTGYVDQYITLDVGSRGAYPIVFLNGFIPASHYGNGYIAANDYKTLYFDKTICASRDSSGNWVYGVWLFNSNGANNGHQTGVPPELCVALINEINALSPAQPVHMYFNLPHLGLQSSDPDYSVNSNYAVKAVDVILNGSTVAGKSWAGLTSAANLFLEYSNETWNTASDAFGQSFYLLRRGFHRFYNSNGDKSSMSTLRSSLIMDDVKQAFSTNRIKYVLGGQGTLGVTDMNLSRMDGSYSYSRDSLVTGNTRLNGKSPFTYPHDYFCFASYIDADLGGSWDANNLSTLTTSWVGNIGDSAAQEANCASYVAGMLDTSTTTPNTGSETIGKYLLKLASYSSKATSVGPTKRIIEYEGGWDPAVSLISASGLVTAGALYAFGTFTASNTTISGIDSGYVSALAVGDFIIGPGIPENCRVATKPTSTSITVTIAPTITTSTGEFYGMTPQNAFKRACKRSAAWSTAYLSWLDGFLSYSNTGMPSLYVPISERWGHVNPDNYGNTIGTEWAGLDQLFINTGTRNRALSV